MVDGIAQLVVAFCDYHDNPWGDYLEINLGFLARPAGAGDEVLGSFVYRMPVDQEFTCKAGNQVMGFPKTVAGPVGRPTATGGSASPWTSTARTELAVSFPEPVAGRRGHRGSRPAATRTSTASPTRPRCRWTWARA